MSDPYDPENQENHDRINRRADEYGRHADALGQIADSLGTDLKDREQEVADLEQAYNAPSSTESGSDKLKKQEEEPRYGPSARDEVNDTLGKGYKPNDKEKKTLLSRAYNSDSKTKKRVAIAGALAGGSLIGGILVFLALLPLKLESIVQNLEGKYSAQANDAVSKEMDNAYAKFIKEKVMPNLGKGSCHSTIDISCVSDSDTSNPVGKMYHAWKEGRLEQKMAAKGLVIGKRGNAYYMNFGEVNGYANTEEMNKQLREVQLGTRSIFDLGDNNGLGNGNYKMTRNEIRRYVRSTLKDGTLWDKTYTRFKVGKLLESKYGIKRCIIACNIRDKFTDNINDKKLIAKAAIIDRVLKPFSESKALVVTCILAGTCDTDPEKAENTPGTEDAERTSGFEKDMRERLTAYAAKYGSEKLADIVKQAEAIGKDGLSKYIARQVAEAIVSKAGAGDAAKALAGDTASKFIPVAGWINTAASIITFIDTAGPKLRILSYVTAAPAAVSLFMAFRTVVDEQHSGHVDAQEIASFGDQLNNGGIDASTTPMWADNNGTPVVTSQANILNQLLPSAAFAAGNDSVNVAHNVEYLCKNGKPVPAGQKICDEEKLNGGLAVLDAITDAAHKIPGWDTLASIAGFIHGAVASVTEFIGGITKIIPGLDEVTALIGKLAAPLLSMITNYVVPNPFADGFTEGKTAKQSTTTSLLNMVLPNAYAAEKTYGTDTSLPSGGRTYDMMTAGADIAFNSSCQIQLGCARISPDQVAKIQNERIAEEKANFDERSVFSRMFATDTPYSMVSRLAMTMPTSTLTAANDGISTMLTNPISRFGSIFSSIFSTNHAFAATEAANDAFGIPQVGYPTVPDDPENYWNKNCVNGPMAIYDKATDTLNIDDWLNSQPVDPSNGQAVPDKTNPCLLIQTMTQSGGGALDPDMLPKDSANPDAGAAAATTPTGDGSLPTGTTQELAKQIWDIYKAGGGISFQTPARASEFKKLVDTGKETAECGRSNAVSPKLLGVILALHQKYDLVLGVFIASHACGTYHEKGMAVDINGIKDKASGKTTGNQIHWSSDTQPLIKQFYVDASATLSANGGGGMGQKQCFSAVSAPTPPKGVTYFEDACTHVHLDIGSH